MGVEQEDRATGAGTAQRHRPSEKHSQVAKGIFNLSIP